ncbi:hypothetical protein GGI43DRAFT_128645 [Trichoderma evansii]
MALSISDSTSLSMLVEAGAGFYASSPGPWKILNLALLAKDRRAAKALLQKGFELPAEPSTPDYNQSKVDYSGTSRDLLALTYSENFVPLNELYETYCYALWKAKRERKSSHDAAIDDIEGLIRCLFETLEDATGPEQWLRKDKICSSCQKFQSEAFYIYEIGEPFQYVLHNERNHLNDSADKGCSICGLIADGLDQAERNLKSQSKVALDRDGEIDEFGVFPDYKLEFLENCYVIDLLNFPNEPPFKGYGYPMWPNGRPSVTIKLLLQPTGEDLAMFRRVGIRIVPGQATNGGNNLDPEKKLTPLDWLIIDEEIIDDREVVII